MITILAAVGVVVVGPGAGGFQERVENELVREGVVFRAAPDLARAIGVLSPAPPEDSLGGALLDEARTAFYEDRLSDAQARIETVLAAQTPHAIRVRAAFWKVAILLAAGDSNGARNAALEALRLDPDAATPATEFPPAVILMVEEVRRSLTRAKLEVRIWPSHGVLSIDGRTAATGAVHVVTGPHEIAVSAPGFLTWTRTVDVGSEGSSLSVSLPIAFPDEGRALQRQLWDTAPEAADLEALALRAGVDRLVLVALRGSAARVVTWTAAEGASPAPIEHPTPARIASWLAPKRTPVPPPGHTSTAAVEARVGAVRWERALSGRSHVLGGAGASVAATATRGHARGLAEIEALDFGQSSLRYDDEDGTSGSVRGGTLYGGGVGVGGGASLGGVSLSALGVVTLESYKAVDPGSGLFPSHDRATVGLRLGAEWRTAWRGLLLDAGAGVSTGTHRERPSGATGSSPTAGPDFRWTAMARLPVQESWILSLAYHGERRTIAFDGSPRAGYLLEDGRRRESLDGVRLALARSF